MDLEEDENLYMVVYRNVQMAGVLEAFVPGIGRFVGFTELFVFKDDITCVDTMLYSDNTVCKVTLIYNLTNHEEVYNILSNININVVED